MIYRKDKRDVDVDYDYDHQTTNYENPYQGEGPNGECGTVEDCFDLPCPRFGWRVKVTYVKECGYDFCPETVGFSGRLSDPVCRTIPAQ